jgi:hypothetical protein
MAALRILNENVVDESLIIDKEFSIAFNEAKALYDADRLDECIAKAQKMLGDPATPRYHRMKTLVLLASTLGDWIDAYACCVEAETLWALTRQWHPEGKIEALDIFMTETRNSLDELYEVLAEEEPDFDMQDDDDDDDNNDDKEVADARARMEDLDLNVEDRQDSDRQPFPASSAMESDNCK